MLSRALLITAVLISVCATSCRQDHRADNYDQEEIVSFIENQAALYNTGKIHDYKGLVRNLDLFYGAKKTISPQARTTVYATMSRYYFELRY